MALTPLHRVLGLCLLPVKYLYCCFWSAQGFSSHLETESSMVPHNSTYADQVLKGRQEHEQWLH